MIYLPVFVCIASLIVSYWLSYTPLIVPVIYVILSFTTLLVYARDKAAARYGTWRVPESTLHMLALLGGWPGAIVAQEKFRHKTRKLGFRIPFWITVAVNIGAFVWIHTRTGGVFLNSCLFKAESIIVDHMNSGAARSILLNLLSFRA